MRRKRSNFTSWVGYSPVAPEYRARPERPASARVRRGRQVTVEAWEQGLLFRHGALVRALDPGGYRFWSSGYSLRPVDVRPWIVSVPAQEVSTSDGVSVKVTAAGQARVVDAAMSVTGTQDASSALYLAVQIAMRDVVGRHTVDELVATRTEIGQELLASLQGIDQLGLVVDRLDLKDIVVPGDLKRAQASVLIARAEGQAALERARGETAALRGLANAARLTAENPALYQLRLLQQLASTSGHTVVIGTPPPLVAPDGHPDGESAD
jgi:regulator of protease activity HflC (stomatin/prohibitin superfamily)